MQNFLNAPQKASKARFIYLEICGSEICVISLMCNIEAYPKFHR